MPRWILVALWMVSAAGSQAAAPDPVGPAIATLKKVGSEGAGNDTAQQALAKLEKTNPSQLPVLLAAIDSEQPLASNWLRSAIETIVQRANAQNKKLPLKQIEAFVVDRKGDPRARRFAFEILAAADPTTKDRLIPTMLDDPSVELRRDAVAQLLDTAEEKRKAEDNPTAIELFEKSLKAARDEDQVKLASEKLKELGHAVDLPRHFGFLMNWKLIGPFDNVDKKGYPIAYPPEAAIDFAASYPGKVDTVKWLDYTTTDDYGQVDLNKAIGKHMGAIAYAAAEFTSDEARPVELRLGTETANKLWLNGKLIWEVEVYHALTKLDQYTARGELKRGKNVILLKLCQNEQTEDWAQDWKFQLRVCDAAGTAILSTDRDTTAKVSVK